MDAKWIDFLPLWAQSRIRNRLSAQTVIANSTWLIADKILRLAVSLPITLLTARHFGASEFGRLNYALALASIFSIVAAAGVDSVLVRDLARRPDLRGTLLGSALFLKLLTGSIALIAVMGIASLVFRLDRSSLALTFVVSFSLVLQSLDTLSFWFQAQVRSRPVILAKLFALALATAARVYILVTDGSLIAFAAISLLESLIGSVLVFHVYHRSKLGLRLIAPRASVARQLFRDSWPLLIAGIAVSLYSRLDVLMLQSMAGSTAVGVYTAATRLSEVWFSIPMLIVPTMLPALIRLRQSAFSSYISGIRHLYSALAWMAIAIALPLSLSSNQLVELMFGPGYEQAGPVLAIHLWSGVAVFLGIGSSQHLLVENRQTISMFRTVIGLVCNVILNLWLIPSHGAKGAAIATLVSYFAATFSLALFPSTRAHAGYMVLAIIARRR